MSTLSSKVQRDLSIGDLTEEFEKQAGRFFYYGYQRARAEDRVRQLEEKLDLQFGDLYAEYRQENPDAKENDCKAYIRGNESYQQTQAALRKARLNADVLKSACRAFDQKESMLMQLGADRRSALDSSDLDMKKKKAAEVIKSSATRRRRRR